MAASRPWVSPGRGLDAQTVPAPAHWHTLEYCGTGWLRSGDRRRLRDRHRWPCFQIKSCWLRVLSYEYYWKKPKELDMYGWGKGPFCLERLSPEGRGEVVLAHRHVCRPR